MRFLLWLSLALAACAAHAEPWLCTLADGRKEFSYELESARNRNCVDTPISRGYVRVVPRRSADPLEGFPRVDAKTQKQRDVARREILERELDQERKALTDAIQRLDRLKQSRGDATAPAVVKEYEERIRTHRTNIANLEKELRFAS